MQIDNKKIFRLLELIVRLSVLLFVGVLIYILLYSSYSISTTIYSIFFIALSILLFFTLFPLAFFSFSGKDNILTFLFHKVNVLDFSIFRPNKQRIIIPIGSLTSFIFEKKGLATYLILSQKTKNGNAEYPPIDITYLSSKKRKSLEKELKSNCSS